MKRRILSTVTALCMLAAPICTPLPDAMGTVLTAHAEESGTCGENLTWTMDAEGNLTISGTGEIERMAFLNESKPTSVTIADGVTSIGGLAFHNCVNLTTVTIPDSVTSIGDDAFEGCESLTSITIPKGVTEIKDYAFADCTSLSAITVSPDNPEFTSIDGVLYTKDLKTLVACPGGIEGTFIIPDSVTTIREAAFEGCKTLTSITIPGGVTKIGARTFCDCTNLTTISIPDGVTWIKDEAFCKCSSLTDVTLPNSLEIIGNWAFQSCTSLTSITIPRKTAIIGRDVFQFCKGITICGEADSEAEEYAKKNNIPFKAIGTASEPVETKPGTTEPGTTDPATTDPAAPALTPGDVNGDKTVDIMDCIALNKFLVGAGALTDAQRKAADLTGDGDITAEDSLALLKAVLGIQSYSPAPCILRMQGVSCGQMSSYQIH